MTADELDAVMTAVAQILKEQLAPLRARLQELGDRVDQVERRELREAIAAIDVRLRQLEQRALAYDPDRDYRPA